MTRLYGRCPVGQRLVAHQPQGHYQTSTMIAGMGLRGPCAPWLFEGAMDGEMFLAWVGQGLVPQLQPGDWVIMDNLATHKVSGVRAAIEGAGARLEYLPPYSPDFNPIEFLWKKVKKQATHLKYFAEFATLIQKVDGALHRFANTPNDITSLMGLYCKLLGAVS